MRISKNVVMAATAITVAVVATGLALALIESNAGPVTLIPARAVAAGHPGTTGKPGQSGPVRHGAGQSKRDRTGRDRTGRHKAGHSGSSRPTPAPSTPAPQPTTTAKRDVGGHLLASSGVIVHDPPGSPSLPNVPASAYVIATADNGQVLAAKDPHGLYPPASTLKVLTAITMLPRLHPDSMVLATKLAASVEPNIIGVIPGHRYRAADLFRALLMISANDAAVSLAQASGSLSKGLRLMNAEAHHLRAYDVVAKQPNGLPAAGQVVSAYDLALIARRALHMASFMRYDQTLTASFPVTRHHSVSMVNQNSLLTQYRGGIGGKIGWTVAAGATYIGMARRHGVTLIVTIMHATPLTEITSAEKLLNWGFAMDGKVHPVGVLVQPLPGRGSSPHRTGKARLAASHLTGATRARRPAAHAGANGGLLVVGTNVANETRMAGAHYSYALTGHAWLRRARLVSASVHRDHGGLPESHYGKSP